MELMMKRLFFVLLLSVFIFQFDILPQGVTFSQGPYLNDARTGAAGGVLKDGRVMIFGGHGTGFVRLNTAEIWDPSGTTFTKYTMNDYRDYCAVIPLNDGRALLAGGSGSDLGVGQIASMEIFDQTNNSFTPVASMTHIRTWARGAQLSSGKVLIVGSWWESTSSVIGDLYDPASNTCAETGGLLIPRSDAMVLPMNDGTALVLGGNDPYGGSTYSQIDIFNPDTKNFTLYSNNLIPNDTLWFPIYEMSDFPQKFKMQDGRYIMLAGKNVAGTETYKLITVDPAAKMIDTFATSQPLPFYDGVSGDSTMFLSPILDKANNMLYMVSIKGGNGGGMIKISTLDLTTHDLNISSGLIQIAYYFWDTPRMILKDKRIFIAGGNISNNFDPVNATFLLTMNPVGVKDQENMPIGFSLKQNYPNPFNPSTIIGYSVPKDGFVAMDVYNILGEKVSGLVNKDMKAGKYEVEFNGSKLPSGIYICRMQSGGNNSSIKMILQK